MNIKQNAQMVLDKVLGKGATGDLIIDESESLSLSAREGELEEYKISSSRVFGLRVIKDNKVGTAYSEASDREALETMVGQAFTNASFATEDEHEAIMDIQEELSTDDDFFCPHDDSTVEQKIDTILALEAALLSKNKIKNVPYNGIQSGSGSRHLFSTAGLVARSSAKSNSCYAYALMEEGDINVMEGSGRAARVFAEIEAKDIANEVYQRCEEILKGKPVESKRYDVIFDSECQPDLFGVFSSMFSGKSAKDGVNPMKDKLGTKIADHRLNLLDSPLLSEGFGYTLFDAEGMPTKELSLIENGELKTFLHNSSTADFFETKTTANATRGPRSTLGVGLHQLMIRTGDASQADLRHGEYLEITDLTGLHSGANAISGNFSFGASGFLCLDGQRIQPVRQITVAGNFFEMLERIRLIGDVANWNWSRSCLMPSIRFADVAVSG